MLGTLFLAGVTILLPADASSRGTEIELGEVATVMGADAATLLKLEALPIMSGPIPGYRRVVDRSDILRRVRAAHPGLEVTFQGRPAVSVSLETVVVDAESILAAVDARLTVARGNRDVTWSPNRVITSLEVPRDEMGNGLPTLDVVLGESGLRSGLLPVTVNIRVGGVVYRSVHAEWQVAVWEELPVLLHDVPAGSRVTSAMFHLARVQSPSDASVKVLQPASTVGAIARVNLTAGSFVAEQDVTRPKVVQIGDELTLVVTKGSIRVTVKVLALETAGIGDFIRVRRTDSNVELKAQVKHSDLVTLDLNV